jgi:DNA-binding NtrC family response regulator
VSILMPPLRDRTGDIPLLAERFAMKFAADAKRSLLGLSPAATAALVRYRWPGNVRELENAIERAVVLSRRPTIELEDLPDHIQAPAPILIGLGQAALAASVPNLNHPLTLEQALKGPERQILIAALQRNHWNRQITAAELNINRTTLYKKMRKLRLGEDSPDMQAA